jgi:hypothetical protein
MKQEYRDLKKSPVANAPVPKDQTGVETGTKLDQAIEDIHSRANHMGAVLEEIMHAHPHGSERDK